MYMYMYTVHSFPTVDVHACIHVRVMYTNTCAEEKVTKIETLRKANRESERERRGVSHFDID